jgi:hypothetical protein
MNYVCAHAPGVEVGVHRAVTTLERDALICHYVTGRMHPLVGDILRFAHRMRLWFACDCRSPSEAPPILFSRRMAADAYTLVRMADRPAHSPQCPFFVMPGGHQVSGLPFLPHLLYRWLQAAKLNLVYPYEGADLLHTQFLSLKDASRSLELAPGQRLFDYSRTHAVGLPDLLRRLAMKAGSLAPGQKLSAVFLTTVPVLSVQALRGALSHPTISWVDRVSEQSLERVTTSAACVGDKGPHAVIFRFECGSGEAQPEVSEIFAQPIFSRGRLVAVDGAHERRTLTVLLTVQQELLRTRRLVVAIRKTLPDSPLYDRGIFAQVHRVGPNGRAVHGLDVVSVDCVQARRSDFERASQPGFLLDEALHRDASRQGTLYHFVEGVDADRNPQSFAALLTGMLLTHQEPSASGSLDATVPAGA